MVWDRSEKVNYPSRHEIAARPSCPCFRLCNKCTTWDTDVSPSCANQFGILEQTAVSLTCCQSSGAREPKRCSTSRMLHRSKQPVFLQSLDHRESSPS